MILVLKHIDIEGPGTLGVFLEQAGKELKILDVGRRVQIPASLEGVEAVISLGGPMNVDEEARYTFLRPEDDLIKKVLVQEMPFLGLCLGGQLLAKAGGGTVVEALQKEIGFFAVTLTAAGQADPLFADVPPTFPVFQWHEDMFQLPQRAMLLASSAACPHQAFRLGQKAYALQFHVEVTDVDIKAWTAAYVKGPEACPLLEKMLADYQAVQANYQAVAQNIFKNFLTLL